MSAEDEQGSTYASDTGRFALVPEWVLTDPTISEGARIQYAIYALKADYTSGETIVKRRTIARLRGCSLATVDRAQKELAEKGLIRIEPRFRMDEGSGKARRTSNRVTVVRARPLSPMTHPLVTGEEGALSTGDEGPSSQVTEQIETQTIETQDDRDPLRGTRGEDRAREASSGVDAERDSTRAAAEDPEDARATRTRADGRLIPSTVAWDLAKERFDAGFSKAHHRGQLATIVESMLSRHPDPFTPDQIRRAMAGMDAVRSGAALRDECLKIRRADTAARERAAAEEWPEEPLRPYPPHLDRGEPYDHDSIANAGYYIPGGPYDPERTDR